MEGRAVAEPAVVLQLAPLGRRLALQMLLLREGMQPNKTNHSIHSCIRKRDISDPDNNTDIDTELRISIEYYLLP